MYAGVDEGMNGLSTRFAFKISGCLTSTTSRWPLTRCICSYVLSSRLSANGFPQGQADAIWGAQRLSDPENTPSLSAKEIQTAYLESTPSMGRTFSNIMSTYADFTGSGSGIPRSVTGQLFDRESLNTELEKSEKPAGINARKDFRNEIVQHCCVARANNSGRNPNWTSYEKLRTVIEEKCSPIPKSDAGHFVCRKTSTDEQKKTRRLCRPRQSEKGYTRKQVRLLCEWYLPS